MREQVMLRVSGKIIKERVFFGVRFRSCINVENFAKSGGLEGKVKEGLNLKGLLIFWN